MKKHKKRIKHNSYQVIGGAFVVERIEPEAPPPKPAFSVPDYFCRAAEKFGLRVTGGGQPKKGHAYANVDTPDGHHASLSTKGDYTDCCQRIADYLNKHPQTAPSPAG